MVYRYEIGLNWRKYWIVSADDGSTWHHVVFESPNFNKAKEVQNILNNKLLTTGEVCPCYFKDFKELEEFGYYVQVH